MKNIFKLMGVALIAGSLLFTACKKDEDDTNNNNNGNNNTPNVPEGTAKVTFGSETFDAAGGYMATELTYQDGSVAEGVMEMVIFKNMGSYPYIDFIGSKVPGNYTAQMATETQYPGTDTAYTYPAGTGTLDINAIEFNPSQNEKWMVWSASYNLNSIDLNALKASFTINATMWDYAQWYFMEVNDVEDADTKTLKVEANNFQFQVPQQ